MSSTTEPTTTSVPETATPSAVDKGKAPATAPADSPTSDSEINGASSGDKDSGLVCNITLLLTSGTRHPYKLDDKYLVKRNVKAETVAGSDKLDPFSISVYTLKEMILREWREEWEGKPASPSSIRLIFFGKLLDDKEPLRNYSFSKEVRNVVHMSIRPADIDDDNEPKHGAKAAGGSASAAESTRCCVIL